MKALASYGVGEWLSGDPLAHRLRRARNILVDRIYRDRKAEGQAELVARLKGAPSLAFTVAFNLPGAIALLADAMGRFVPGTALVVCDNSNDPEARAAIAELCRARGLFYCPLPPSPYRGKRNGSRSHGVALNWILANLVRPAAPKVFAFLDHDLVPLAPADLPALVKGQLFYGMVRQSDRRDGPWYLWPGFSVFDYEAVKAHPLDFGTDTPLALDTGGQNWTVLYRHFDLAGLRQATRCTVYLEEAMARAKGEEGGESSRYLLTDGWLHIGGVGHRVGGLNALERTQLAFAEDPDGLLARLLATAKSPPST